MPTYNYRCPQCGDFTRRQRMTDVPLSSCPECGARIERLIGRGVGIQFKGPGFYLTETRSNGSSSED